MSTLGSVLSSALSSLQASQLGLSIASNNISNAQTPGYSRERLVLAPSPNQGVDVLEVQALRDQITARRLNQETSNRSAQDTLHQALQDIQGSFNDTQGTGLLSYLAAFFNSFQALSVDPTSMTNREAVKQSAQSLISEFHSQASNLNDQQQVANQGVASDVDKINSLTSQIAQITSQIQQEETPGQPQNALRDQRAQLVRQLSEIVDAKELESNGSYQLTLSNGTPLVLNGDAQALSTSQGTSGLYAVMAGNTDVTSSIGGGDLKAQLQVRDQMIPSYVNQLDQLAYEITQHVNSIHYGAYDLDGNTGNNFFAPLTGADGAASGIALDSAIASNTRKIAASQDGSAGDNSAAIAIGNLLTSPVFTGGSVTNQYASLVYNIGNDTTNAQSSFQEHDALVTQLQNKLQSISGVSIDEEAAQILQFQRSFQASAQMISTVNQMMQTALAMGTTA
jgi:flagellar hook-associated protein 1 FlgK